MIVASLLLALPFLDRPVSIETNGDSVAALADQLSEKTGAKIKAGPSVRKQIMVVQVREKPLKQFLDQVGQALGATWTEQAGEITIYRTDAQEKGQIATELKAKIDALERWRDAPQPRPMSKEEARSLVIRAEATTRDYYLQHNQEKHYKEMAALILQSPGNRAAQMVRAGLDIDAIATVGNGRRLTFSSQPNRLQLPLKAGERAIDQYFREIDMMRAASEASLERVPLSETTLDVRKWPDSVRSRPDRVLVAAYRLPKTPQILIRTYFVKGKLIVGWISDSIDPVAVPKEPLPKVDFKVADDVARRSVAMTRLAWTSVDRPLYEKHVEPASWVLGPLLRGYAEARKKDLVACVPDAAIDSSLIQNIDKHAMPTLERLTRAYMVWREDGDTVYFKPDRPHEQRVVAMDREAFWRLSDSFLKAGKPSFTAAAEYLAQGPVEPTCSNLQTRMTLMTTGVAWDFSFWGTAPVLRFWGSLPPKQREGTILMSQVNGTARKALNEWVFGTNLGLQALDIDENDPEDGGSIARLEASERLPNGFPDDMLLTSKIDSIDVVWQQSGEAQWPSRLEDAYNLLDPTYQDRGPVALGTQRVLKMEFSDRRSMRLQIDEPTGGEGLTWGKIGDLPGDILAKLKAYAAKAKASETPKIKSTPPPAPTLL